MADLITIATTAALTQFVGPTAKHLGEQALARAKQVAGKASAYLAAVGREPQPVEPKLLLPMMQGAGLETDPTLAELWAALLANAADPTRQSTVTPVYAEILRQLTSQEAELLNSLFVFAQKAADRLALAEREEIREVMRKDYTIRHMISLENIYYTYTRAKIGSTPAFIRWHPFETMIDSFLRQQLLIVANVQPPGKAPISFEFVPDKSNVFFTSLGYDFMQAVTPPTP